jgi:hypothetical protein
VYYITSNDLSIYKGGDEDSSEGAGTHSKYNTDWIYVASVIAEIDIWIYFVSEERKQSEDN